MYDDKLWHWEHVVYDSYGNIAVSWAADPYYGVMYATAYLNWTNYGYTGEERDAWSGYSIHGMRWMDYVVARWLTEDPTQFGGGDPNLGRYVGNSPTNAVDFTGLANFWIPWTWDIPNKNQSWGEFFDPTADESAAYFGGLGTGAKNIGVGAKKVATGEAGKEIGDRSVSIYENLNGKDTWNREKGRWGEMMFHIGGQTAGTHAIAEGSVGIDSGDQSGTGWL
ncbi:MAG: RHS repeat-associated core domain-containing protein [Pirellulales bacterium]